MKIYFAGSIRGGREDAALYLQIIDYLKSFGEVLTEHVGDPKLTELGDDGPTDRHIHDREVTKKLFDVLVQRYATRVGGVTRIFRLQARQGDNAPMALVKLIA